MPRYNVRGRIKRGLNVRVLVPILVLECKNAIFFTVEYNLYLTWKNKMLINLLYKGNAALTLCIRPMIIGKLN
jgi:hypothetical protein